MDFFIPGDGRWKISYVAIDCPTIPGRKGNVQLRFQGSNPWYIKLQARNTKLVSWHTQTVICKSTTGDKIKMLSFFKSIIIMTIIIMTFLDSTITGNSSSFQCGPDTNIKILKSTKTKR